MNEYPLGHPDGTTLLVTGFLTLCIDERFFALIDGCWAPS
jgi:hypothetical protein